MTIRFGLCLLPVLLAAGCTTSQSVTSHEPAVSESFAMLPDTAIVPLRRGESAKMEAASSPEMVRSGSVEVVKQSSNADVDRLIASYAASYEVPEALVRRVVKRESNFRPGARNGPYWGLMQILPATARSMGYDGPASGLLDADTNLRYAVKYLKGAYLVAGGDHDQAVRHYARGYYFDAKRKGLLEEAGLTRRRMPPAAKPQEPKQALPETVLVSAEPAARADTAQPVAASSVQAVSTQWNQGLEAAGKAPAPAAQPTAAVAADAAPAPSPAPEAPRAAAVALNAPTASAKGGRVGGSTHAGDPAPGALR